MGNDTTSHWEDQSWSAKPIYIGIDGTFINAQLGKRFLQAKVGIVFTEPRIRVSQGRNLRRNKQYVVRCQSVSEFGQRRFCCATEGNRKQLIVLAGKMPPIGGGNYEIGFGGGKPWPR
ncbi:MAG: hypothetical protein QGI86_25455 [Candidatus Poribacteria bacterium]|jgi:hypothetical protein|nr:hypothetical protein [Candidatus Poribacteria bacterium]MDP6750980.1 hypothetical protein [Candidatus Poribacteria bacterium]MDP6998863.1 hypothetical protein [Candidatus Poribacteria bacterium]